MSPSPAATQIFFEDTRVATDIEAVHVTHVRPYRWPLVYPVVYTWPSHITIGLRNVSLARSPSP